MQAAEVRDLNERRMAKLLMPRGCSVASAAVNGVWRPYYAPKLKKRTVLFAKLREFFRRNVSQPVGKVIEEINPIYVVGQLLSSRLQNLQSGRRRCPNGGRQHDQQRERELRVDPAES